MTLRGSPVIERVSSILRLLISWSYLGLIAAIFVLPMLLLLPSRRLRICAFNVFGRITGRVMVSLAGGSLPPGIRSRMQAAHPAIYVSNHTSYLDNFLASWAIPIGTVGIAQAWTVWVPFFGNLYAISGNVLVNRETPRTAVASLRELIAIVERHRLSAVLWPEGGRSIDGRLQPFKRGFVHLALATRLPVVPVVVSHAHHCWGKGSVLTRKATLNVQVLDPIPTRDWTSRTIDRHVADVHARFAAALPEDQRPDAAMANAVSPR